MKITSKITYELDQSELTDLLIWCMQEVEASISIEDAECMINEWQEMVTK